MLTAEQVRSLRESLGQLAADAELYKILLSVAEDATSHKPGGYIYWDLQRADGVVDAIAERLRSMGYQVQLSKYPEDGYSDFTIKY